MADYTVNDGSADVDYNIIAQQSPQSNVYELIARENTRSLSTPQSLRISHTNGNSADSTDRHLVAFATTEADADNALRTATCHVVIAAPRVDVTEAEVLKEWTKLKNFITTNFSAIYRGNMP